jgi:signal transduction histidine kinase
VRGTFFANLFHNFNAVLPQSAYTISMGSESPAYDKISLLRLAFKGLEDHELQDIAALTEFRTYPPDYVLCHEGAYEDVFYIVADGNAAISKKMGDDEGERVLRVVGKGDMVGEMALIQNVPRSACVRTTTECTVLEMEKKDFETILSHSTHMAMDIIRITLDRMRSNDQTAIAELQKTNKVLRRIDRNKSEFIQVTAHELRTPLTVVNGYVNVLQSLPGIKENATLASVIQGIVSGANRMHEVVNMMLDMTRMDADTLKIAFVPVLLKWMVNDLAHELQKAAEERKIEITTQHTENTPSIYADPTLVQKALYHLIINAIKYTPDGGKIAVSTRPVVMDDNVAGVEISVKDNGIGLDAEYHELVFEKFYQVGSVAIHSSGKTTFKGGGPGLGLALVRGVARAHGGKVWVESTGYDEVNLPGCTFYLQLPVMPPGSETANSAS